MAYLITKNHIRKTLWASLKTRRSAKAKGLTTQCDNNRMWSPETTKKKKRGVTEKPYEEVLKDHTGRKIGEIRNSSNKQTIHDHTGRKVGEYRPSSNSTHDHTGRKIGSGNLLTSLIR